MGVESVFDEFIIDYDQIHEAYWSNTLSEYELKRWHEMQLRTVLHHVKNKSEFYARHFKDIDVDGITLSDLGALPFTTKDDLRESMMDILSGTLEDSIYYYETTGTTGPATP